MSVNFYRLIKDICPDDEKADQCLVVKNIFPPEERDRRECGAAITLREMINCSVANAKPAIETRRTGTSHASMAVSFGQVSHALNEHASN